MTSSKEICLVINVIGRDKISFLIFHQSFCCKESLRMFYNALLIILLFSFNRNVVQ